MSVTNIAGYIGRFDPSIPPCDASAPTAGLKTLEGEPGSGARGYVAVVVEVVLLVLTTTWLTPSVSACSSEYQTLILSPGPAEVGANALSTALSLKSTLDSGMLLASG